jgi:membrane-bound serine protease (ClpP class)
VSFVLAFVLLLVLPSPWNLIGCAASLLVGVGEVTYWNRTVKGRRVRAGAETLLGSTGTVISPCRPNGQIRVSGEIWEARCEEGADPGDTVTVVARDQLTLVVAPGHAAT